MSDKKKYIEEEAFIIEHSGEIPEVALHSSIYFLKEDPEGPGLSLDVEDILPLKLAVIERYRIIILRDLNPENRDKTIFRGLARCAANWHRLLKFGAGEKIDVQAVQAEAAIARQKFLINEVSEAQDKCRPCINCSLGELETLINSLGISDKNLPKGWRELCPVE